MNGKKKTETLRAEMLLFLLICPTTTAALLSLSENKRYGYRVIDLMEKEGLIRSDAVTQEKGDKQKTVHICYITPAGVRWLILETGKDEDREDGRIRTGFSFLNYIPVEDTKGASVVPDKTDKERVLSIGEAALVAMSAGASVPFFLLDEDTPVSDVSSAEIKAEDAFRLKQEIESHQYSEEQLKLRKLEQERKESRRRNPRINSAHTLNELVQKAAADWRAAEGDEDVTYSHLCEELCLKRGSPKMGYPSEDPDYIRFVHTTTVKLIALLSASPEEHRHDTDRGRYAGLLQSRERTLLMYTTFRMSFHWSDGLINAEKTADGLWKKMLLPEFRKSTKEETCGTMLVHSAAQFRKLWSTHTRGKRRHPDFGRRFEHFYMTEVSRAGAETLRDIMLTSTDDFHEREKARVLDGKFGEAMSCRFVRTTETEYAPLFPVKVNLEGVWYYCFFGSRFDLKEIYSVMERMDRDTSFGVGVICEPWQHPYYKCIIPEALTYWKGKTLEELDQDPYE